MKIIINGRPLQERVAKLTVKEDQCIEQVKYISYASILAFMVNVLMDKIINHNNAVIALKMLDML